MIDFLFRNADWLLEMAGLLLMLGGLQRWARFVRCSEFPSADGRILGSEVESRFQPAAGSPNGNFGGGSSTYYVRVRYSYEAAGTSFRSDRVYSIGARPYATYSGASKVLLRFAPGDGVKVHYDLAKPGFSFLINGSRSVIVTRFLFGTLLAGLGFWISLHVRH